jgi:hypothetical protein
VKSAVPTQREADGLSLSKPLPCAEAGTAKRPNAGIGKDKSLHGLSLLDQGAIIYNSSHFMIAIDSKKLYDEHVPVANILLWRTS